MKKLQENQLITKSDFAVTLVNFSVLIFSIMVKASLLLSVNGEGN